MDSKAISTYGKHFEKAVIEIAEKLGDAKLCPKQLQTTKSFQKRQLDCVSDILTKLVADDLILL